MQQCFRLEGAPGPLFVQRCVRRLALAIAARRRLLPLPGSCALCLVVRLLSTATQVSESQSGQHGWQSGALPSYVSTSSPRLSHRLKRLREAVDTHQSTSAQEPQCRVEMSSYGRCAALSRRHRPRWAFLDAHPASATAGVAAWTAPRAKCLDRKCCGMLERTCSVSRRLGVAARSAAVLPALSFAASSVVASVAA